MDTFFDYYFHETIFHSMDKFQQSSFYSRCNVCLSENQENRGRLKLARLSLAETVRETEIFRLLITIEPWLLGSPRPRKTFSLCANSRYSAKKQDSLASHGTRYVDTNETKFRIEKLLPSALNRDFHAVEIVLTRVSYSSH